MKRITALIISATMLFLCSTVGFAEESTTKVDEIFSGFLRGNLRRRLTSREEINKYLYFTTNFMGDDEALRQVQLAGALHGTGARPDVDTYIQAISNILFACQIDNEEDVYKLADMDTVKTPVDYIVDTVNLSGDALFIYLGIKGETGFVADAFATVAEGIINTAGNKAEAGESMAALKALAQNYRRSTALIDVLRRRGEHELKEAAEILGEGVDELTSFCLDNFNDEEFINELKVGGTLSVKGIIEKAKLSPNFNKEGGYKKLVTAFEQSEQAVGVVVDLTLLARDFMTNVSNLVNGGANLLNRFLEILAIKEISTQLQFEILEMESEYFDGGKDYNFILDYLDMAQLLTSSHIRGEYCFYSMLAPDDSLRAIINAGNIDEVRQGFESKFSAWLLIRRNLYTIEAACIENQLVNSETSKWTPVPVVSEEALYQSYLRETLVPKYGIACNYELRGTMVDNKEEWLSTTGVISTYIEDLDGNGSKELVVFTLEATGESPNKLVLYMEAYAIENSAVILKDRIAPSPYGADFPVFFMANLGTVEQEWVSAVKSAQDEIHFLFERIRYPGAFTDGPARNFWAIQYQDEKLVPAISIRQTAGDSYEPVYTGSVLQGGVLQSEEIIYDYMNNPEGISLEDGIDTFFEKQGISIKANRDLVESMLAENPAAKKILSFNNRNVGKSDGYKKLDFAFKLTDYTNLTKGLTDDVEARYASYRAVIQDYENQYGALGVGDHDGKYNYSTGLSFMQLRDLDRDGREELILAYNADSSDEVSLYRCEIWSFIGEKSEKIFSSQLVHIGNGHNYVRVQLLNVQGIQYLFTEKDWGAPETDPSLTILQMKGGKFEEVSVFYTDYADPNNPVYKINDAVVSSDQYDSERKKWFTGAEIYPIGAWVNQEYITSICSQTKTKLGAPVPESVAVANNPENGGGDKTETERVQALFDENGLIFASSNTVALTEVDLTSLLERIATQDAIGIKDAIGFARNEIFARYGYSFQSPEYVGHYNQYDWYRQLPKTEGTDIQLNAVEEANVTLLQEWERRY